MASTNVRGLGELWRDIPGYEGFYQASNHGQVRSVPRYVNNRHLGSYRVLRVTTTRKGYLMAALSQFGDRKSVTVHKLVSMTFNGPIPEGMTINHKNGIKTDNTPGNLEYLTSFDNTQHAKRTGLYGNRKRAMKGDRFTPEQVREVRQLRSQGTLLKTIAQQYGVVIGMISSILSGESYSWVTD